MKYMKQLLTILLISFVGELLNYFLPLPIPASIYGMIILFTLLMTGLLKLEAVRDVGMFLIEIMPIMFIPASVGLMTSWGIIRPLIVQIIVITVATLLLVMIISGRITQLVIRHGRKEEQEHEHE
ncbi:MAG TPA: CidA/LrgA family protein [Lachnospiraceae bacterium]|nr:CidA/LrgA family protein [Lachnospiraceae bacterium]